MTAINEVPWMIENGAEHSVQVARNLSYAAFGGREGVVGSKSLEVRETAVPSGSVRVFPGTAAVLNRATGAIDEMYVLRSPVEVEVPIAATGATGRSDLIVARVENPWAAGETWADPADPAVGPYASVSVISNVAAGTEHALDLGGGPDHSMIALARIDLPANTTVVTQAMVRDLRGLSNNATVRQMAVTAPTVSESLTATAYSNWPNEALIDVDVPTWATHVRGRAILGGVQFGTGGQVTNVYGNLRLIFLFTGGTVVGQTTAYNLTADGKDRTVLMAGTPDIEIPAAARGQVGLRVRVEGNRGGGDTDLRSTPESMHSIEVEFFSKPESNV